MALILDGTNGLFGDVTGGNISGNFIIDAVNLQDGSVTESKIASSAVTESKIAPITAAGSDTARSLANRFADVVNVKDFGAVGDGIVNDRDAIQDAIDSLGTLGGMVFIPSNLRCYVGSNIILKAKCSLVGTSDNFPGSSANIVTRGSSLIINQSASIIMQDRSTRIEGLNIYRQGITSSGLTSTQIISTFLGDAIQIQNSDCAVIKCTIVGFYNAIINYTPYNATRLFVSNVFIDCRNGITSQSSSDVTRIENVHCWPIMAQGVYDAWLNIRTGLIAFNFNTFQDWTKLTNCFCFGYETGFKFDNTATIELIGCQSDYNPATAAGNGGPSPSRIQTPNGSSGISISGAIQTISIVGCVTAGSDVGIKVNSTSGQSSIQIDCSHGNTHLVSCIENIDGYVTVNNYTARTGVSGQGIGVQTRSTANRTKISDSAFISLEYGIVQDSTSTPLFISNPTWVIGLFANRVVNGYISTVASANTLSLDGESNVFVVTGNTNINFLAVQEDTYSGKIIVFKFEGNLTVFDGNNIKLNGNFIATPNSTLTIVSDGFNFYELGRSFN